MHAGAVKLAYMKYLVWLKLNYLIFYAYCPA
jgi:hypothetical protein